MFHSISIQFMLALKFEVAQEDLFKWGLEKHLKTKDLFILFKRKYHRYKTQLFLSKYRFQLSNADCFAKIFIPQVQKPEPIFIVHSILFIFRLTLMKSVKVHHSIYFLQFIQFFNFGWLHFSINSQRLLQKFIFDNVFLILRQFTFFNQFLQNFLSIKKDYHFEICLNLIYFHLFFIFLKNFHLLMIFIF